MPLHLVSCGAEGTVKIMDCVEEPSAGRDIQDRDQDEDEGQAMRIRGLVRASDHSCLPPAVRKVLGWSMDQESNPKPNPNWKVLGWSMDQEWLSSHSATKWHRICLSKGGVSHPSAVTSIA